MISFFQRISCFFVFDKDASTYLGTQDRAMRYANQLALLASNYTAHANIVITNAGIEMWNDADRIPFTSGSNPYSPLPDYVTQFQSYLKKTQAANSGTKFAVGVLLSNKATVVGGYSQGPPCSTDGKYCFFEQKK